MTPAGGIDAVLDRRLRRGGKRAVAVALSGGGDSQALTLMADDWARRAGRTLLILTVDHRLRAESRDWTEACASLAARLDRPFRALAWTGDKPATGLPAAARAARHRLLADAAREAGAAVILMGHTADDLVESAAMRAAGSTTPDAREWAPSPAWPEGRGVFLLRPLLEVRRQALRDWLISRGEGWIDDPANDDPRFARSRARATAPATRPAAAAGPLEAARSVGIEDAVLRVDRAQLRSLSAEDARRLVALASVCAGGRARLPAAARVTRVVDAVCGAGDSVSTLAGARIETRGQTVLIAREPGEAARGGLPVLPLPEGREVVWDGRFAVTACAPDLVIRPDRRGGPEIVAAHGAPWTGGAVTVTPLVGDRFRAAAGLIDAEPD